MVGENADNEAESRFWRVVELCLNRFHSHWPEQAAGAVREYRESLPSMPPDPSSIYKEEPFYVACAIADDDLPLMDYREKYDELLSETGYLPS